MEPGIRSTLERLKGLGLTLSILTETVHSKESKEIMLEAAGLSGIFDHIFVPMDTGSRKPNARAYLAVIEHYKVKPSDALFVGHDKDELDGARAVGISSVSYRGDRDGDYYASTFDEIFDLVKGLKED
ncbi:HAD-superfamily hydrolase, subfamily IA, variant 3 [mine drainage metagenome]|uniref:HAD-superfamily hydrolase, subfamily IA, variant 3 n=1 Tax=mine drainage metagenome TaxID=410659 RepID=T0YCN9_9ZZZZ